MILIYFWQLTVAFSLALAFLSSASEQINNPVVTEKSIRAVIAIIRQVDILNFKSCIIKCNRYKNFVAWNVTKFNFFTSSE